MDGTVQEEEVREIRWLSIEDAVETLSFESDRKVLKKAEDYLKN